jgi:hypothetical protein
MVNYPASIDNSISLPAAVDSATTVSASVVNRLRTAILAVQTELGVQPSGVYTNVKTRLDTLEETVGSLQIITLAGDLGGTLSVPLVTGLQGRLVASSAPTNGQSLVWNGVSWAPATITGGGGDSTSPGGSDGYIQFNDSGVFGGQSSLVYDKTARKITLTDALASSVVLGSDDLGGYSESYISIGNSYQSTASTGTIRTGSFATWRALDYAGGGSLDVLTVAANSSTDRSIWFGENPYDTLHSAHNLYFTANNSAAFRFGNPDAWGSNYEGLYVYENTNAAVGRLVSISRGMSLLLGGNKSDYGPLAASYLAGGKGVFHLGYAEVAPTGSPVGGAILYTDPATGIVHVKQPDGTNVPIVTAAPTLPAGSDGYIQFNDSGVFGGEDSFVFDKAARKITLTDSLTSAVILSSENFGLYSESYLSLGASYQNAASTGTIRMHGFPTWMAKDNSGPNSLCILKVQANSSTSRDITFGGDAFDDTTWSRDISFYGQRSISLIFPQADDLGRDFKGMI